MNGLSKDIKSHQLDNPWASCRLLDNSWANCRLLDNPWASCRLLDNLWVPTGRVASGDQSPFSCDGLFFEMFIYIIKAFGGVCFNEHFVFGFPDVFIDFRQ